MEAWRFKTVMSGFPHKSSKFYFYCTSSGCKSQETTTEVEFLNVIGTKLLRVFLLAIHSHHHSRFLPPPPPPPSKSGFKPLVCNLNIVFGNLKSENSQEYAQKPQRNCTSMNLASGLHKDCTVGSSKNTGF
jgi:hypothetical protein